MIISPQSRAALCTELNLAPRELMFKLEKFLKIKLGNSMLIDLQFFIDLHQHLHYIESRDKNGTIITSECPGWVCYVEKVVKDPLISLCSRIKSPMMLAGDIMKKMLLLGGVVGTVHHQEASGIVIAGIAPCHDKKLETFRPPLAASEGRQLSK